MLHDAAVVQNQDVVGPADGAQAMGDDDARASGQQPVDGPLQELLGGRVEPRRSLVEHHQARIAQEDAGEGQQLRLPGRQTLAAALQHRVQPGRQAAQPRAKAQRLQRGDDGGIVKGRAGGVVVAEEGQIVAHAGGEELHVLRHQAHVPPQFAQSDGAQVDAVQSDGPGVDVV